MPPVDWSTACLLSSRGTESVSGPGIALPLTLTDRMTEYPTLLAPGLRIIDASHRPGVIPSPAADVSVTVGFVLAGSIRIDPSDVPVGAGVLDLLVFTRGGAPLSVSDPEAARVLWIEILPTADRRMLELPTREDRGVSRIPLGLESVIAARLTATVWSTATGRSARAGDHVRDLVTALVARHRASIAEAAPDWLVRLRDSLATRLRGPLTLTGLAEDAGVHPVYLARAFRRSFGLPIGRYLRRLRVDASARALASTDIPTSNIAYDVGFYDQSHLNRVFVRETGMPPARFRRLARRFRRCR